MRLAAALALEPAPPSITWVAPAEACPGPEEVEERLVRLLGPEASTVRAEARVEALASGWAVDLALEWRGHRDVRRLVAERCDTLADATVLLVATMSDPVTVLGHIPAEPPPSEDVPTILPPLAPGAALARRSDVAPTPAAAPLRSPSPRDRGLAVGVLGLGDYGSLPRVAGGVGASVGWRWPRARLYAEVGYLPARPVISEAPHARQARVQLATARVGACARPRVRAVELPLCGGVEVGVTRATGFGVRADQEEADPWVALLAEGGVTIPLMATLALVGRVGVAAPVVFSEYVFGDERLYRARTVALRAALGFEFRWGPRNRGRPENPRSG